MFIEIKYYKSDQEAGTESHYQERLFACQMCLTSAHDYMKKKAERYCIIRPLLNAYRFYKDMKGRKTWFRETEPLLYAQIRLVQKHYIELIQEEERYAQEGKYEKNKEIVHSDNRRSLSDIG